MWFLVFRVETYIVGCNRFVICLEVRQVWWKEKHWETPGALFWFCCSTSLDDIWSESSDTYDLMIFRIKPWYYNTILPSRERVHIPPNGNSGKSSSTQHCQLEGAILVAQKGIWSKDTYEVLVALLWPCRSLVFLGQVHGDPTLNDQPGDLVPP